MKPKDKDRIIKALEIAREYGGIDGEHHKTWVIDQMCQALLVDYSAYHAFIIDIDTWDKGIPP